MKHQKHQNIQSAAAQRARGGRRRNARGVTLVEILLVLTFIGIIYALVFSGTGGTEVGKVRGESLFKHMQIVQNAARTQKELLGCYPLNVDGMLTLDAYKDTAENSCGNERTEFNGPYLQNATLDGSGTASKLVLDAFLADARGRLSTAAKSGGGGTILVYEIEELDRIVAQAIYSSCSGTASTNVTLAIGSLGPTKPCGYNPTGNKPSLYIGEY